MTSAFKRCLPGGEIPSSDGAACCFRRSRSIKQDVSCKPQSPIAAGIIFVEAPLSEVRD